MPAVKFSVTWPDGDTIVYYSPSTVIHQFFSSSGNVDLPLFLKTIDNALNAASERVFERYGYYCSAAQDEQSKIKTKASKLTRNHMSGRVYLKFSP